MVHRFWFGVAVSLALGTAFCLVDFIPGRQPRRAAPTALAIAPPEHGTLPERPAKSVFPAPEWPSNYLPGRQPGPAAQSLRPSPPDPAVRPDSPVALAPTPPPPTPDQTVAVPAIPVLPPSLQPVSPPPVEAAPRPLPQPSVQSRRNGGPAPMLPLRRMLLGRRKGAGASAAAPGNAAASSVAFANLADVRDIDPAWDYYDLPEKGLDVWATGQSFTAKQNLRDTGPAAYELKGQEYSLGLRKDWSIDSVIGVSVDIFDAKLTSAAMLDYRTNDLAGYRVNAHYEGVAFDSIAFAAKAFYGRLDSEGGGYLQVHSQGDSWHEEWRETRHGSEMYGFAAKAGLPLLWGPDIKILPEVGVNLTKLHSDPYSYVLSSTEHPERTVPVARRDSTSLEVPVSVTLRKDMLHGWGVLTPLLGLTYTTELDDDAGGVRTGHAAAAATVQVDPVTGAPTDMVGDVSPKAFVRVDLGFEMRTVGGWRMDARYAHVFGEKYTNDIFKLELGRCF